MKQSRTKTKAKNKKSEGSSWWTVLFLINCRKDAVFSFFGLAFIMLTFLKSPSQLPNRMSYHLDLSACFFMIVFSLTICWYEYSQVRPGTFHGISGRTSRQSITPVAEDAGFTGDGGARLVSPLERYHSFPVVISELSVGIFERLVPNYLIRYIQS